jgi:ZIP family zinc transporter
LDAGDQEPALLDAFAWGGLAASSLAIGCLLALRFSFSGRVIGLVTAFAAGVLISAVAYELVEEAIEVYHPGGAAIGLFAGATTFFAGDLLITRRASRGRQRSGGEAEPETDAAMPIVLGTVLDGVPESVVLGLTLIGGSVSLPMLIAVWISNLPEALVSTAGLKRQGWRAGGLLLLWSGIVVSSAVASAAGYGIFADSPDPTIAFILAFAGGAILTMLADSMMPEAFRDSGPLAGLVTTFGFATAYALQALE